jgi:hypothetical protein
MPLWKITEKRPSKVKETKFKQEKLLEEHLEDRIVAGAKGKIEPEFCSYRFLKNRKPSGEPVL